MMSPFCLAARENGSVDPRGQLRLTGFDASAMPALQAVLDAQMAPQATPMLIDELTHAARGHGTQAVIVWRGDAPVACAGWVTFGIAQSGQCFGSPVVAADAEAADQVIAQLVHTACELGASSLRISAWAGEDIKRAALERAGFACLLEWIHFAMPAQALAVGKPLSALGLVPVPRAAIDWPALLALYNDTFRNVPNAPQPDLADFQSEWAETDTEASCVLADAAGAYHAFAQVSPTGKMEAIGVDDTLRGRGVAAALYAHAARSLAARGIDTLRALVASSNAQSVALHTKLGFVEERPRGRVYALELAPSIAT